MPQSIATLRDLVADLQKVEEDHLEQLDSMAAVTCMQIWDGDTTASVTYLNDKTVQFTV